MMKIAIAGTNGFAQYLATCIQTETPYQFIVLSRRPNDDLSTRKHWQIVRANYHSVDELEHLLVGVDIVISTIAGPEQIKLINAAAAAEVGRFVPSEFCGHPTFRTLDDPTDNAHNAALSVLAELERQKRLNYTVFSCGLFYERFGPGGLQKWHINISESLGGEQDLLMNRRAEHDSDQALIPTAENGAYVSIISARDAARYVVAALKDLRFQEWPTQFIFRGQHSRALDIVNTCSQVSGRPVQYLWYDTATLMTLLASSRTTQNRREEVKWFQLLAIAQGRYDLPATNLDQMVHVECESFEHWLRNPPDQEAPH